MGAIETILALPWGRQPGRPRAFVTDWSEEPIGSMGARLRTLWLDRRPLVEVRYGRGEPSLRVVPADEAERRRAWTRARGRAEAARAARDRAAILAHAREGGTLMHVGGQRGGRVWLGAAHASAPGVARALGVQLGDGGLWRPGTPWTPCPRGAWFPRRTSAVERSAYGE